MVESASWRSPVAIALGITVAVTACSTLAPQDYAASLVALVFFAATYWLVLRDNPSEVEAHGLALGGVLEPKPFDLKRIASDLARSLGWSAIAMLAFFPAFWLGYLYWAGATGDFKLRPGDAPWDELFGQVVAIALPEEMFYRGYLQTRLDRAWTPKWKLLGARIGPGLLVASAIFAFGHVATTPDPNRLAVFFPSLAFGWLRAKTGGIGAAVLFHAACNLFAAYVARGYALH